MSKDTGGPAFPTDGFKYDSINGGHQSGMTLRDYFAAKAMHGMLANPTRGSFNCEATSSNSYAMADAMLAERNK